MSNNAVSLDEFLAAHASVIRVALTRVRGSSPRNEGTEMFASAQGLWGTIGGGQLEFLVSQPILLLPVFPKDIKPQAQIGWFLWV